LVLRGELPVEEGRETRVSAVRERSRRAVEVSGSEIQTCGTVTRPPQSTNFRLRVMIRAHSAALPTATCKSSKLHHRSIQLLFCLSNGATNTAFARLSRTHAPTTIYNHASSSEPWRRRHVQLRQVYALEQDAVGVRSGLTWNREDGCHDGRQYVPLCSRQHPQPRIANN
jgi:hypothetical protein